MNELAPSFTNAQQLLARYPQLGIPHFQRGLVWNDEATALLLESLYRGTPCGNIILWRPQAPDKYGEACVPGEQFADLLVDGQQRTRMLYRALAGGQEDDKGWCLDLTCAPSFGGLLAGEPRANLFVYTTLDPQTRATRYQHNTVPLSDLLAADPQSWLSRCQMRLKDGTSSDQVQAALLEVKSKVAAMQEESLFGVVTLQERDGRYGIDEVVSLYNRINSAGKRVEAEEMAFATLVKLYPTTVDRLRSFFAEVHGSERGMGRDDLLKRQRERSFGFKLYLRTFVQVCNYHFARSSGSQDLSFGVIDSDELRRWFAKPDSRPEELFVRTTKVLMCVHRVLRDVLNCDDLRMLPDTECLIPALQTLIRFYPAMLDEAHGQRIAYLILRRALEPNRTQVGTLDILKAIDASHRASNCCASLMKTKGVVWSHGKSTELKTALANASTLNDRYVLMLYWLIRRRKAVDFVYGQLPEEQRKALPGRELPVAKDASPEKQHICPSSALGRWIFGNEGRITTSRHIANNIGNLTYISQALNGWGGLEATWMDTDMESAAADNLDRHFLAGASLEKYGELRRKSLAKDLKPADEKTYDSFIAERRALIQQAFESWLLELEAGFADCPASIEPEQRLANRQPADFIRALEFPDMIEDALIAFAHQYGCVKTTEDPKRPGRVVFKVRERGRASAFRVEAISATRRIEIEPRTGHKVYELFREILVQKNVAPPADDRQPWPLSCEPQDEAATSNVLAGFISALTGNVAGALK